MQKFRFLLPLFILTVAVLAISYSVRSYSQENNAPDQTANLGQNQEASSSGDEFGSNDSGDKPEPIKESPGLIAKIINIVKPKPTTQPGRGGTSSTPAPSSIETNIDSTLVDVPIDQEKTFSVLLPAGTNRPTAYTFNLTYDPTVLTVVKLETGDTWDKTTVLDNEINASMGTATISAGQALGSQNSSTGTKLITVHVKAKSNAKVETQLLIEDSSEFAYVGLDDGVPLKSKSI